MHRRYQLLEKVGEGGMGAVYKAHDNLTGATVALKQVTTSATNLVFNSRGDSSNLHIALALEFQTLASLRHPNIISVLDYGFDENRDPFFTMEYLDKAQTITDAGKEKSLDEKLNFMLEMLQSLVYLHQRDVLHRDLKPDNVLVVDGQVKVMDFGLSLVMKGSNVSSSDTVGTIAYMAPELFQDASPSKSADLYAVGVMAYELIAGHYPFKQDNIGMLIRHIMMTDIDVTLLDVNEGVIAVLEKLLAKTHEDRYSNVRDVIRDLYNAIDRPMPLETVAIRESFLQAAKFVGRDAEMQKLRAVWNESASGKRNTWLVGGESGVGKSRLLDELRIRALVDGALVLRGQTVSEGGGLYHLWRDVSRNLILYSELADEQASILKPLIRDIGHLLDKDIDDAPRVNPQQAQLRLFNTVASLFRQQAQPVLLILEDLHWARSESLALLDHLSQNLSDVSILIIGNYRDDERPDFPENHPYMQHMKLKRLDADSIAELSVSMLGETGKQPQVIDILERETEGNVFFLVEVVRALAEDAGQIENIGIMTLPQTIFAQGILTVIERRLNKIPDSAQSLLQYAAIIGRQLDLPVLKSLNTVQNFEDWLVMCSNAAVLEIQGDHWRFTHDKLREHLLSQVNTQQQSPLYRTVAEAMETVHSSAPRLSTLAYLWRMAGNTEKEFNYSSLAGQQALKNSANLEAISYLERALDLLETLPKDTEHDQHELMLQLALGSAISLTKGHWSSEAEKPYSRARELSKKVEESSEFFQALWGQWLFYSLRAGWALAVEIGDQLLALAERSQDEDFLLQAHHTQWTHLTVMGDLTLAHAKCEQGIQLYDRQQHHHHTFIYGGHDPGVCCRMFSGWVLWLLGYPEQAQQRSHEAVSLADEVDHAFTQAVAMTWQLYVSQARGEVDITKENAQNLITLASEHSFPWKVFGSMFHGWAQVKQGQSEEGLNQLHQGLSTMQAMSLKGFRPVTLTLLIDAYREMGMIDEGLKQVSETLAVMEETGECNYEAEVHRLKGELLLLQGDTIQAEISYHQAIDLAQSQQAKSWELRATSSLARLWQSQGKSTEAHDSLSAVYNWFTEGFDTQDLKEAKALLDKLATV